MSDATQVESDGLHVIDPIRAKPIGCEIMPTTWWTDKTILVTGASGTVGSRLLRELLHGRPRVIRALDSHEHGLFQLQQSLGGREEELRWLLGDVRDLDRLRRAMEGVDVVFHCAALKHVSIGEYNPFEIVRTNLIGLQNITQAAIEKRVAKVIFTSSDKAVNPTNAMGASKLMGERLIAAANEMRGSAPTRFASVRFGNILGSNGSVVDVFRRQIASGGPVTLTDRRMTRFVLGLKKAVKLVIQAAEIACGGEVFVLKMPVIRIADLADVMIHHLAPHYGFAPEEVRVTEVGALRGEKLYEELLMEAEVPLSYENGEFIAYLGDRSEFEAPDKRPYLLGMRPVARLYHSGEQPLLTRDQLEDLLSEFELLDVSVPQEVAG